MRDINRIDGYCEILKELWRKQPDMRFGQFISNVIGEIGDPFYLEDETFFNRMKEIKWLK